MSRLAHFVMSLALVALATGLRHPIAAGGRTRTDDYDRNEPTVGCGATCKMACGSSWAEYGRKVALPGSVP